MAETVYGTHEDSPVHITEGVQTLAAGIYKEFEQMMKRYDEDVVHNLTPLIINVLETLEKAVEEKLEGEAENELLKDDNEQLLTQYEREKQLRKSSEQKYLEFEDAKEEEVKDRTEKIESLESLVRMFELKTKNAADQILRHEDKERETKKEFDKLHDRYTELFKTHMDYAERTKMMMNSERIVPEMHNSPRNKGLTLGNLKINHPAMNSFPGSTTPTKPDSDDFILPSGGRTPHDTSNTSLKNEINDSQKRKSKRKSVEAGVSTNKVSTSNISTTTAIGVDEQVESSAQANNKETITESNKTDDNERLPNKVNDTESLEKQSGDSVDGSSSNNIDSSQQVNHGAYSETLHSIEESMEDLSPVSPYKQILDEIIVTSELEEFDESIPPPALKRLGTKMSGNESSLFEEMNFESCDMIGDLDDDITGKVVGPEEFSSSESDSEDDLQSAVSENFFGMGKEVDNLIQENKDLLATKNALNIVKDDLIARLDEMNSEQELLKEDVESLHTVKSRLKLRVTELEEELKKVKEEMEKKNKPGEGEEEEDIPMSQRKRFTRVEMARVLMERNQYKERLMELQEAVRWTEMIRASKDHPETVQSTKKKSSGLWNFFGSLFSGSSKPSKKQQQLPDAKIRYNAPTTLVQPVGDPNKKRRNTYNLGDKGRAYEFLQEDTTSDKARREREKERKEQYKQVRAHVKKDDGRMQAYGWSLPAKFQTSSQRESNSKSLVPVPVPVYCRPLLDKEQGMKLWCAAGVNLTGGKTRDGGSIVGASVFYSSPPAQAGPPPESNVDRLNKELEEHEQTIREQEKEQQMSSFVWICTSTHSSSRVTVIDANNPADVLETFKVASSHILCIASVPGAMEGDYPVGEEFLSKTENASSEESTQPQATSTPSKSDQTENSDQKENSDELDGIGNVTFIQCDTGSASKPSSAATSPMGSYRDISELSVSSQVGVANITTDVDVLTNNDDNNDQRSTNIAEEAVHSDDDASESSKADPLGVSSESDMKTTVITAKASPGSSGRSSPSTIESRERTLSETPSELVKDGITVRPENDFQFVEVEKTSSILPTMWLGSQSGSLYVHSAVASWRRCLHSVKLNDSILQILHIKGRVMVALANGTVAVFHRDHGGQWDLTNYHILDLGKPHHSIRCMTIVGSSYVWCGFKNRIHVVDPKSIILQKSFDAHPRKESQVRQLAWVGDGVWVSIRLDSTLRLYHAYTHQHLQDVDIEPYVSKMLGTGKLGFSFVRITSLLISSKRLWIGTGNGVIISVPLCESNKSIGNVTSGSGRGPGGVVRVYADTKTDAVTPGSFIPFCSMAQAQLSFHGHRDAVKFFVAVPGLGARNSGSSSVDKPEVKNTLIMSGGEGYIDFRIGDGEEDEDGQETEQRSLSTGDRSHLIVWEIANPVY